MAKRKRRKGARGGRPGGTAAVQAEARPGGGPRPQARRARKEEARAAREVVRRRARRVALLRRGVTLSVAAAALAGVALYVTRGPGTGSVSQEALRAGRTAGCGEIQTPESGAPGDLHLQPGQAYQYDQRPATSGYHDPTWLPPEPRVYPSPVPETQAVHNLEHAYVLVYYRAEGADALPQEVVDRLASQVERENKVIMAPHPNLQDGTALALAAWNKLWECPGSITPDQASTVTRGFIQAYRGSGNAPEPGAP